MAIFGTPWADFMVGTAAGEDIFGFGGNDFIRGEGGADNIYGGSGIDTASYSTSAAGVMVMLESGFPHGVGFGGDAEGDKLYDIENAVGSNFADTIYGSSGANDIQGLNGHDTLKGMGGDDTLWGGLGNDTLMGGAGMDALNGGSGTDTASYNDAGSAVFINLITGDGYWGDAEGDTLSSVENVTGSDYDDHLWGDDNANVLRGGEGADSLKGGGGMDTLYGGDQDDNLYGHDGVDTLYGENGNDSLDGGNGSDVLNGGGGIDTLTGGNDNDDYYVSGVGDIIVEAAAGGTNDRVFSSADYALTAANVETVQLTGSAIAVTGSAQNNTLYGNALDNFLNGAGNSAAGGDSLFGGLGNDQFYFQAGQAHGDTIYDFTGNGAAVGDVMVFSGYGTAAAGANLVNLGGGNWQINSADGTIHETIVVVGAVDASDFLFV